MLDIKFIRENPQIVKEGCKKKQVKVDIDRLLEADKRRREILQALEDIRAQKNKASKEISRIKNEREKRKIILKMRELDKNSDRLNKTLKDLENEFNNLMLQIPNLPFGEELRSSSHFARLHLARVDDVPIGKDEKDNVILREWGEKPKFDSKVKNYLEIAENLDLIDIKRAAKVSGTRFGYLKREAALIEFALINFAFDTLIKQGFIPVIPPVMIKPEMALAMGYLEQTDDQEAYFLPKDNLYLVGTAEQSLGSMHAGEIFEENDLPKRYAGFSTCFRREAGSYGKDTRGMFRVHQFDKVEMFSFTKPEDSIKEHKFFLSLEEELMTSLKLPYQVVNICTADLGRPAAAKYDIEAWVPSQKRYRETHSTSNCTDFQARRLNIRYKDKSGKTNLVHTINGTAFSMRPLIAILEIYQRKDGKIDVPKVLQKYLPGHQKVIPFLPRQ